LARKRASKQDTSCPVVLTAKNDTQKEIIKAIRDHPITFISGPAGSGKTYVSVVYAYQQLLKGNINQLILTRPCVEACGERLGFLPGSFSEKLEVYLIPLLSTLYEMSGKKQIDELLKNGVIQTIPLAYQRGITFKNAIVIGDEFQGTTPEQMRMFLTRLGENCKMVITGDPEQSDIQGRNGLVDALERFVDVPGIAIIKTQHCDVVRHPMVAMIDQKYREKLPSETGGNGYDFAKKNGNGRHHESSLECSRIT
jgi:phosphate starvation-inducible PhoH-like protein